MSAELEATADEACASCGKAEVDNVKLKKCACNLVKYCSVECQKNHRPQHKRACKKRLAEIREKLLLEQPEISSLGECPICCLPLSLHIEKSIMTSCCCNSICIGCWYANILREMEQGLEHRCAFCREPVTKTQVEIEKNQMKRIKANDPNALSQMGARCYEEGDYGRAVEYFTKAAGFGNIHAHYCLSISYGQGEGVERDTKKQLHHLEEAAIGGHPLARFNLGCIEAQNKRFDRAVKHHIIAANLGYDKSLDEVKKYFLKGLVSKEDFASALRGHQAAVDATKSQQRDAAEEWVKKRDALRRND